MRKHDGHFQWIYNEHGSACRKQPAAYESVMTKIYLNKCVREIIIIKILSAVDWTRKKM